MIRTLAIILFLLGLIAAIFFDYLAPKEAAFIVVVSFIAGWITEKIFKMKVF